MNRFRTFASRTLALGSLALVPAVSFAQGSAVTFDPSEAVGIATSAQAFIIAVGTAVLVMLMVAKGIKWARKAG